MSRIALGTWAIGGWMWGGTDEKESIQTIHTAVEHSITLIDTAPVYGLGRWEKRSSARRWPADCASGRPCNQGRIGLAQ